MLHLASGAPAVAKLSIKIKKPTSSTFKSWFFVLVAGLVLAAIAILDSGRLAPTPLVPAADGSTGCQFKVTTSGSLNVRATPEANGTIRGTLADGTVVDTVGRPTNGFRQLRGGYWASADHLTLVSGTDCG
ncbi:SH3 domain-containing protein [Pseudonocardia sp. CA-107938]|uniref:SH3 domain-containing protein n=1 Tax=Pseudonocardia sp. CA-107938 TaxID=3240021 RepID=UPI003D8E3B99